MIVLFQELARASEKPHIRPFTSAPYGAQTAHGAPNTADTSKATQHRVEL